ncbi:hypothetical protein D3C81_870850 [compost metagenome]
MPWSPGNIFFKIQDDALILPMNKIDRGKGLEIEATPAIKSITCWIDIISFGFVGVKNIGICIEAVHNGVPFQRKRYILGFAPMRGQMKKLLSGKGYDVSMTGMKIHINLLVDHFKTIQIIGNTELVFSFTIHIIHQDILVRLVSLEDT